MCSMVSVFVHMFVLKRQSFYVIVVIVYTIDTIALVHYSVTTAQC